jgi:hypothetical protein
MFSLPSLLAVVFCVGAASLVCSGTLALSSGVLLSVSGLSVLLRMGLAGFDGLTEPKSALMQSNSPHAVVMWL